MARTPAHRLAYRVHFAAIGWADRHGHAGFAPGRLAALLGKEGKPLSEQSTRNAVARAKELDLVSPRWALTLDPGHTRHWILRI
ncbi:hypothetical protein [Streptomyces althioticus]|uniref:hypothetical protein n=1 Tax=Streptomyces althioticus TaxID=83380 RepID=UPI0036FBC0A3